MPAMLKYLVPLCSLLLLAGCGDKDDGTERAAPPPRPVEVANVDVRPMAETVNLVGSLAAAEGTEIRSEIAGRIAEIRFKEGDQVRQGQVLFRLDDRELRAQLAEAKARMNLAREELNRARGLLAERFISQSEFDRLQADFDRAEAVAEHLGARLEKTEIRAPFSGVVGARDVSPGAVISTDTALTRVDDVSRLTIEFAVPERFLPQVEIGTVVRLPDQNLANGALREGKVYFISPRLDPQRRAAEIKALIEDPSPSMRPGMFANVELVLRTVEEALTVPEGAILSRADGHFLVVVRNNDGSSVADFVPVELGIRTRGVVQVIPRNGEPTPGLTVVSAGVGSLPLFPGAPLMPRPVRQGD